MPGPRLKYSHWLFRLPWMRAYDAICLGRTIYFRQPAEEVAQTLLRHEMVHQAQMDHHGVIPFYARYLWAYLKGLVKYRSHRQAYWENPFEVEAREVATHLERSKFSRRSLVQ